MKNKGFTITEMMIVLLIIGILVVIVFPSIHRARIESNHVFAKATLNTIGKALEIYNTYNYEYPTDIEELFNQDYIKVDYFNGEYRGYIFTGESFSDSYAIVAEPINSDKGKKIFTLKTGAIINEEDT